MEERNNLMIIDDYVVDLTTASNTFCSMEPKNDEDRKILFRAANNPDKRVSDMINLKIKVKDIYVETVMVKDRDNEEIMRPAPRIVLIDDKKVSYQCVSVGMLGAFKKLITIYGLPTWEKGIEIEIKQITKGDRSMLTFNVV